MSSIQQGVIFYGIYWNGYYFLGDNNFLGTIWSSWISFFFFFSFRTWKDLGCWMVLELDSPKVHRYNCIERVSMRRRLHRDIFLLFIFFTTSVWQRQFCQLRFICVLLHRVLQDSRDLMDLRWDNCLLVILLVKLCELRSVLWTKSRFCCYISVKTVLGLGLGSGAGNIQIL